MHVRVLAMALALAAGVVAGPVAKTSPCEIDQVARVVAVGDVHGAYGGLVTILRAANIVNDKNEWIGGKAHLVQVGDVVDRGPDSRKAIDLLRRLEGEAAAAGGQVHYLLGNHEVLRMLNSMTYATPGEFAAFATPASAALREQMADSVQPGARAEIMKMPLGQIELMQAFAPKGEYGSYLRRLDTTVRINGVVFVHGGISPKYASMSCSEINAKVLRDLDKASADPQMVYTADENDPLWYRGLALEPEEAFAPEVDAILSAQHARAMVVAHTPRASGRIGARFGGKVFLIDTGMQTEYWATGRPSALEITADGFKPIYAPAAVQQTEPAPVDTDAPRTPEAPAAPMTPVTPGTPAPATMPPSVP